MRVLLLSAYHAQSHQQWCEGLMAYFPEYQWQLVSLPPRYFNWHMRGNALIWSTHAAIADCQSYDLIVATSMVDLHGLRGFHPSLAGIPCLLYFHENQFDYPQGAAKQEQIELQLISVYSALCADQLVFNSLYNYKTFVAGLTKLLKKLPDFVPDKIVHKIKLKSDIVSVPLPNESYQIGPSIEKSSRLKQDIFAGSKFSIVWNHRWEYDKWPECLFLGLLKLKEKGIVFDLHVLGQQFRRQPPIFAQIKNEFGENIRSWGTIKNVEIYRQVLRSTDVVVSTAIHDFQGLAVLEAVASGCVPVVPDRLAYPQFFQQQFRYPSFIDDEERQASALADHLSVLARAHDKKSLIGAPNLENLSWPQLGPMYAAIFEPLFSRSVAE